LTQTATAVVTSEHPSARVPIELTEQVSGRGGVGKTTFDWTTADSHGTTYLYVEYIKPEGTYNAGPHRYAQRLDICKNPSPNLAVYSEDILLEPDPPAANDSVQVAARISNLSSSTIATATNFEVRFHTSGPSSSYQQLGSSLIIPELGPGMSITVPVPPDALAFTMVDPYYAVQVTAWPRVEQGDANYGDNEATTTLQQKDAAVLELRTTVGTEPDQCADTEAVAVDYGIEVFYCHQMTNKSDIHLSTHSLSDSRLGSVFSEYAYDLSPGETLTWIEPAVPTQTMESQVTWTAFSAPYVFTEQDRAKVYVIVYTYMPLVFNDYGEPEPSSAR
jgi:hypothetical protein